MAGSLKHPKKPPSVLTYPDAVGDYRLNHAHLLSKIIVDDLTGCWNFTGPKHRQGYGFIGAYRVSDNTNIQVTAHRASYMLHKGPITSRNVIHTCSNMACINPDHLKQGTQKDTMAVMIAAGRQVKERAPYKPRPPDWINPLKGCKMGPRPNWKYKWTADEIRFMRTAPLEDIMSRFNFDKAAAYRARYQARRGYKWVPEDV